jgi:hypothetical protein
MDFYVLMPSKLPSLRWLSTFLNESLGAADSSAEQRLNKIYFTGGKLIIF